MYYQDILQIAKDYRKTFGYEFDSVARRDWRLYLSLISILLMAFSFALIFWNVTPLPAGAFFALMLIFEASFFICFAIHGEHRKDIKAEAFRQSTESAKNLTKIPLREKWISMHIKLAKEDYLGLVEQIEKIQSNLKAHQTKSLSYFDHYIKMVSSWSKPLKVVMLSIAIPLILTTLQAVLKEEKWAASLISIMTPQNFQAAILWAFGIVVAGALISFLMSMVAFFFDYHQDFKTDTGCSESSLEALKYDLVRFSEIKLSIKSHEKLD